MRKMRKTKTFSIPPNEVEEIEKILNFCKEHDVNYSAIIRKRLKEWYNENKAYIQKTFYSQKVAA